MAEMYYGKMKNEYTDRSGVQKQGWLDAGMTLIVKDTPEGTRYYLKDHRNPTLLINFFAAEPRQSPPGRGGAPSYRAPHPADEGPAF